MRITSLIILLTSFSSFLFSQEILDSSIVHHEHVIYFKSDAYDLKEEDKQALLKLLGNKENFDSYEFFVDAHTDDVGSDEYNKDLSERRKQTIVDFLIQNHIPEYLIESNFHGESLRVAFAEDAKSRQLNRRAIVQLITKRKFVYVQGVIIDEETKEPINAEVQINTKTFTSSTKTDSLGKYKLLSPIDSLVTIEVVAKDYFIESKVLKITEDHKDKFLKIPLPKVEIGKKFTFKNMLFEGNKSIMLERSVLVLDHLKRFMFVNTDHCIEIAGHINRPNAPNVPKYTINYKLSVARALEVHNALVDIGVGEERLLARGYGNWQMLYPKAKSELHQRMNRRVEIVIAECDSTRLIENHWIEDLESFKSSQGTNFLSNNLAISKKKDDSEKSINTKNLEADISGFPPKAKSDILSQIKKMKEKGMDITLYTYKDLLKALPNLPEPK